MKEINDLDSLVLHAPELQTEAEKVLSAKEQMIESCRIKLSDEFKEDDYLMSVNDVGMFPRANISFVKAKEKSGKTLAICIMAAAALKGELWKLKAQEKLKVVLIDTEQSPADTQKNYRRIMKLAGMEEEDRTRLEVYNLRTLEPEQRLKVLEYLSYNSGADLLFNDGLVDMIGDFNNPIECKDVVDKLMKWSAENNLCLVSVIHENPGANGKMRGHLGTIAAQKSSEVLKLTCKDGVL